MTNAQKWVAAFLLLFLFLFFLSRITKKTEVKLDDVDAFNNEANTEQTINQIIANVGCNKCHGDNLKGTDSGPSLVNIGKYWSKTKLFDYLRNPDSYGNGERFVKYKKKYKVHMISFNDVDVKILGKIADYVLQLK